MTAPTRQKLPVPNTTKQRGPLLAWAIGIVCGAELVLVALIGGAGLGAFFGLEGAVVGVALTAAAAATVRRRRTQAQARSDYGDPAEPNS